MSVRALVPVRRKNGEAVESALVAELSSISARMMSGSQEVFGKSLPIHAMMSVIKPFRRSTSPFDCGEYFDTATTFMPAFSRGAWNCSLSNAFPLSRTISAGRDG